MSRCARPPKTSKARLLAMSEKDFDKWLMSKMDTCQCKDCTTYNECANRGGEQLYCVASRSPMCIESKSGCLCKECPVFKELGFNNSYHCLTGPEIARHE